MAIYLNKSMTAHHTPYYKVRMLYPCDEELQQVWMIQLDGTELEEAKTLYPVLMPTVAKVVILYGDFARNVLSALLYKTA
jgi:hypothetical protein